MGLFKKAKRVVKKVTKPIAKVLDKVVPNEIKPYLPYLAAVAPVLGPMGAFGAKVANLSKLGALGTYGLGSLASQLAQEGSEGDFDVLPVLSAGLTGYLAAPGTTGMTTAQALDPAMGSAAQADVLANRSFLTQAKDLGITGVQGIEKFVQAPQTAKGFFGTTKAIAQAASPAVTGQIGQDAYNFAKQAEADYLAELDAFNALAGEQREASNEARRSHITASMLRANFTQDVIDETLDQLGLLLKDGGRVGYQAGGVASLQDFRNALQKVGAGTAMDQQRQIKDFARNEVQREIGAAVKGDNFKDFLMQNVGAGGASIYGGLYGSPGNPQGPFTGTFQSMRDSLIDQITRQRLNAPEPGPFIERDSLTGLPVTDLLPNNPDGSMKSLAEQNRISQIVLKAQQDEQDEIDRLVAQDTGIASFKDGGIMNLGGKEMDMRTGGFIPIGAKERADDVPARLSKNEFVMTADAVRAAGGGSVNKGAKRMYDLMHKLEARA